MKRIKQKLLLGLGCLALAPWTRAANTPIDATITVTPVANVSLAISPTTYAFGNLDVNTSSFSATKLTLSNNGEVDVTVDKRITAESSPAGWTAGTAAGADTYVLYAATATARPQLTDFSTANHRFGALNNVTALKGLGGSTPVVNTSGGALPSVDLWFRLDMPTTVSAQTSRTITVRFTGTGQ